MQVRRARFRCPRTAGGGQVVKSRHPRVVCSVAKPALDAQKLVVLGRPIGPAERPSLDLSRVGGDRHVGNRGVLSFARAVRDNRCIPSLLRHRDRGQRLGQRADLVQFDKNSVGDRLANAALEDLGIGHEQVIADQLHPCAQRGREL